MFCAWYMCKPEGNKTAKWQLHAVSWQGGKYPSQQMRSISSWYMNHCYDDPNTWWDRGCTSKQGARLIMDMLEEANPGLFDRRRDVVVYRHKSVWDFYKYIGFNYKTKKYAKYNCETVRS